MAHRSRLTRALARAELRCIICGCSENNPCVLIDEQGKRTTCSWVSAALCSNPECIEEWENEYGEGVVPEVDEEPMSFEEFRNF